MTLQSKKRIANRIRLLTQRLERENYKLISKVFKDFSEELETQINKSDLFTIDFSNFTKAIKRTLFKMYNNSSAKTVQWCKTLFGWKLENSVIETIRNKGMEDFNSNVAAARVTYIDETTRSRMKKYITNAQARGINTNDIAKGLKSEVMEMSYSRAKTIARTETSYAVNNATHFTALEAGMNNKTWLHVGGGKEDRETHLTLDGKTIKMNEKFNVGGYLADHPHDSNLPARESINCYCITVYE
ncbi:MAG: phage minor head protein [Fusobacteriaceae bacterium]